MFKSGGWALCDTFLEEKAKGCIFQNVTWYVDIMIVNWSIIMHVMHIAHYEGGCKDSSYIQCPYAGNPNCPGF